jgi:hypothetical protein
MKAGVVSSSQIGKYNRMDPGFHLAVKSVEAEVAALEASKSASDLAAQLNQLTTADLGEPLEPLLTGAQSKHQRPALTAAIEKYPFIAYALVLQHKAVMVAQAKERLAVEQAYVATLDAFGSNISQ